MLYKCFTITIISQYVIFINLSGNVQTIDVKPSGLCFSRLKKLQGACFISVATVSFY